jgi:hypothetical protein
VPSAAAGSSPAAPLRATRPLLDLEKLRASFEFSLSQREPTAVVSPGRYAQSPLRRIEHDGQHSLLKPELAQERLDRRDFVGLLVALETRQHQGRVRCKGAENMRSLAVAEIVEAQTQRLTVHGEVPLFRRRVK